MAIHLSYVNATSFGFVYMRATYLKPREAIFMLNQQDFLLESLKRKPAPYSLRWICMKSFIFSIIITTYRPRNSWIQALEAAFHNNYAQLPGASLVWHVVRNPSILRDQPWTPMLHLLLLAAESKAIHGHVRNLLCLRSDTSHVGRVYLGHLLRLLVNWPLHAEPYNQILIVSLLSTM